MSTTVTYKGSTLTTVSNQTRTLKTAGKYMEGDVILVDITDTPDFEELTVTPSDNTQVFTPYADAITYTVPSSTQLESNPMTGTVDLSFLTYGKQYKVTGMFYTRSHYRSSYSSDLVEFDTLWTASEDGEIAFSFSEHEDEHAHPIKITLSKTEIKVYYPDGTKISRGTIYSNSNFLTFSEKSCDAYSKVTVEAMPSGTEGTPTATKGTVSNNSVSVTPSVTNTSGYITGGTKTGTAVTVSASELVSGTLSVTSNGTKDVTNYASVNVNISSETPSIESLSVTPSESEQTFNASTVDGYKPVTVGAISSTYVGSGITRRSSTDLTVSGATVTAPAGYYSAAASKSVATMTLPTAATSSATSGYTSKATIGRSTAAQYINIPPGYNSAGAYYVISAVANGSATAPASISGTAASVSTGNGTLTLTKTVSVTPSVTAGYVSSGTAGNSSVSLTASVTIDPTPTASGATVTIPAGYYSAQTTKSVTTMTLPTSAASSATSGYTKKATISRSTSDQYINIAPGYNSAGGYYKISAVANGSATGPTSLSGTSATVSTGTNTLTLTKTGVTTTPTVTAGYVSSATTSTATVTLTASVTTKAAATITPTTSNQTIAAGTYLTGAQTIAGDADLVGSNILSTANIFGVQGTVDFIDVYIRSTAPTSSVGSDGDIYIQE